MSNPLGPIVEFVKLHDSTIALFTALAAAASTILAWVSNDATEKAARAEVFLVDEI